MDFKLGCTVSVVDPFTLPRVALIVVEPEPTLVASPFEPAVLLIVATPVADELQVTVVVMFCVLLSEYVPVAVNCSVCPCVIVGLAGVTAIEVKVGGGRLTVSLVDPETPLSDAWMVVEPPPTLVAKPLEPAVLLMVATVVADELHVTEVVMFCVLLSE